MLPPSVPKLRISGEAIVLAASDRSGSVFWTSADSMTSLNVVAAPRLRPLPLGLMPFSSGMVVMSTRADGSGMPLPVTQSFMMPPTMSLPPARILTVAPSVSSRPTASATLVGSCRSKAFIASPLPHDALLRAASTRARVSGMFSTHTPTAL